MPLFEKVNEIFKNYGFTVSAIVLAAWTVIGAVIRAITTSLKPLGKGIGKLCKMLAKKQLPFARPHLLDREFHFQSGGTGHLIFGGAHLAYNFCCGRFVYGKVSQAQPLTLPNKRTCQKNCSHNEQRLVYVVTCGRWRGYGEGGRVGRRLSQTLRFHCCLVDWI